MREGRRLINGVFGRMAAGAINQLPQNQRLRAEAPAIIRDALAKGLVVKAPYGCFNSETRYIEWTSDDDERVIASLGGKIDRDTFWLYQLTPNWTATAGSGDGDKTELYADLAASFRQTGKGIGQISLGLFQMTVGAAIGLGQDFCAMATVPFRTHRDRQGNELVEKKCN